MTYKMELTEEQMRVTEIALEEYFRLRCGQKEDFCADLAAIGRDLSAENPNHDGIFRDMLTRRAHLYEIMQAFFHIAYEPTGYLLEKTDDMMIAECIWDAIRFARGRSRWGHAYQIGPEPSPRIEAIGENAQDARGTD